MAARYRYISCHPVTNAMLHSNLDLIDPKWNWTVGGNGQLTAKITVPEDAAARELLRGATNKWQSAIYVKARDNSYPWGGPIVKRTWNRKAGQITIQCVQWRAWLYMMIMEPWNTGGLDLWFEYLNQDQLAIARQLVQYVVQGGLTSGCPPITYDSSQTSGKARDLTFWGSTMQRCGTLIDSMANRDGGFEWTLAPRPNSITGLPSLHFYNGYPELGGVVSNLHFKSTPKGSNCDPGDIEEDASQEYNRFWTTGAGQPPDQIFAWDIDPNQVNGTTLRLDGNASYSSVIDPKTLFSHARKSRKFYSSGIQTIPITHNFGQIDPDSYACGDRGRLQLKDRWVDIDQDSVRVISKEVNASGAGSVSAILDLTDYTLPEVDAGGAI